MEPCEEWFNGVFFTMPNCVSLSMQVDNMRELIRAPALVIAGNSAVFQPLDPFGRTVDSITEGNKEVGYLPVIVDVAIGGSVECIFVVLDTIVEPSDLFLEVAHLTGFEGFMLSNG